MLDRVHAKPLACEFEADTTDCQVRSFGGEKTKGTGRHGLGGRSHADRAHRQTATARRRKKSLIPFSRIRAQTTSVSLSAARWVARDQRSHHAHALRRDGAQPESTVSVLVFTYWPMLSNAVPNSIGPVPFVSSLFLLSSGSENEMCFSNMSGLTQSERSLS